MVATKNAKSQLDPAALQSDVASFASSLGFSSAPSSGFNDSDFRKTGPIRTSARPPSKPPRDFKDSKFEKRKDIPVRKSKPPQNRNNHPGESDPVVENSNRFKNLPKLPLVRASALGVWYNDAAELEEKLIGKDKKIEFSSVDEWKHFVEEKKELGERLLVQYAQDYLSSRGQHGDIKMLLATQRSGTAADKVSALSVLIGDNAVGNLRAIDSLLGMVTSKVGKRHAFTAFEALKEMFLILLPNRKLKTLFQRPLNHLSDTKDGHSLLLFWHWEESLKERYERFVSALHEASLDVIVKLKSMALKIMFVLLKSKSEQERRLLSFLVNKLGDPENKVASNADYHLANLLAEHPNMKAVVIDEVDNFLFRPHLGLRAKYHAVNFLSQVRLSPKGDGPKAAKRLVDIYFALFKVLISEAGAEPSVAKHGKKASSSSKKDKTKDTSESHVEMDSRLLSALLTGVNRAFPFVSSDEADDVLQVQTPLLFKLVHSKNFNVGVQALMLLDKISSKNQIVSDRFYCALYSKLLLPAMINSSKEEMFIALILRVMKNDINIMRVAAFAKRLLQVALQLPPQHTCGCLFLLSEVLKARPPLWNMMLQNEAGDANEDLEHFEDIPDNDDNQAGNDFNKDKATDTSSESDNDADDSIDRSNFSNSDSEENGFSESDDLLGVDGLDKLEGSKPTSDQEKHNTQARTRPGGYDPRHREPRYCNAERVGWWELTVLAQHVHPSVAAMARTLLSGVNIVYNGNPLADLSLGAFLDKFMEKKPKQNIWHGASQIEPAKKIDMNRQMIGAEILKLAESDVAPEDVVFHKFYMNRMNSSKKPKKKKKKTAEDEAAEELYDVDGDDIDVDGDDIDVDGDDESDNEEIDNMLDFAANPSSEAEDHDYDDLDEMDEEDDEDLIRDASEDELGDTLSDVEGEASEDGDVAVGEADDDGELDETFDQGRKNTKRKRKRGKSGAGASPFASLEDYQHLMEDEDEGPESNPWKKTTKAKKQKQKSNKKRKASS
ncbi:protein SLOW WALKER 2 [Andrographis paniculata]|uniref:protein SLOW WALKER 2 n=1 Tax=Andrographis paniculata TaxID=175694 RepID=UPI0021E799F9|nr:protein SLOW WALKER 2 [Andrographis paniculata]